MLWLASDPTVTIATAQPITNGVQLVTPLLVQEWQIAPATIGLKRSRDGLVY